jgi:hypothetical protein
MWRIFLIVFIVLVICIILGTISAILWSYYYRSKEGIPAKILYSKPEDLTDEEWEIARSLTFSPIVAFWLVGFSLPIILIIYFRIFIKKIIIGVTETLIAKKENNKE